MNAVQKFRQHIGSLRAEKKLREAIAVCDAQIADEDLRYAAYSERADLNFALSSFEEAFADIERLMELRPTSPSPYYVRAGWNLALGHETAAVEDASIVIASGVEYFLMSAYFVRALANFDLGNKAAALEDCMKLPADFKMAIESRKLGWRVLSRDELHAIIGR